jgi:hypothetical protein
MDVYWKSGSYLESAAAFTQAGPTTTEPNPAAKLAKASAGSWRISWLQENPKVAGSNSRELKAACPAAIYIEEGAGRYP